MNQYLNSVLGPYEIYLLRVGELTIQYSGFEHAINQSIWALAGLGDRIGACITSEVVSIAPKFRILSALLHELGHTDLVKAASALSEQAISVSQFRNKYVHSPIGLVIDEAGAMVPSVSHIKIEGKKLKQFPEGYDEEELNRTIDKCLELKRAAIDFRVLVFEKTGRK